MDRVQQADSDRPKLKFSVERSRVHQKNRRPLVLRGELQAKGVNLKS